MYADWQGLQLLGVLSAVSVRGKELFPFTYDSQWLASRRPKCYTPPYSYLRACNTYRETSPTSAFF